MSGTVGQRPVAIFNTPVNHQGTGRVDANEVRGNDNTLRAAFVQHDTDATIHVQSSALVDRPAPGVAGRLWVTPLHTDRFQLWWDDGTQWREHHP